MTQVAKDTQAYFDAGKASPALEFLSPIKGPALEQICIQVGTGQVSGAEGCRAVRRGRQEAGAAVGSARLGLIASHSGCSHLCQHLPPVRPEPAAGPKKGLRYGEHMSTTEATRLAPAARGGKSGRRGGRDRTRTGSIIPAAIIYVIFFVIPTFSSFYFSFTRWDLFTSTWIGLKNYQTFFHEQALIIGLRNTLIYAVITSGLKVVLGMALALLLTSKIIARGYLRSVIFFPVLVSTIGVGLTFTVLMNPEQGLINNALGVVGINGPGLADQPAAWRSSRSPWSTSGRASAWPPSSSSPAWSPSRASTTRRPRSTAPAGGRSSGTSCCRWPDPATASVITLSLIGGLRSFDLIWAMTKGGPGFASDVIASVIYKQYQAGFYGLSTAGSVVLFLVVTGHRRAADLVAQPRRRVLMKNTRGVVIGVVAIVVIGDLLPRAVRLHLPHRLQDKTRVGPAAVLLAAALRAVGQPRSRPSPRGTT